MVRASLLLGLLLIAAPAAAQLPIATSGSRLLWDQDAPDLVTAQALIYKLTVDAGMPSVLTAVTCTGAASPFTCGVAFPAMTPGTHTVTATAGNAAGDSVPSAPFAFQMVVVPLPPRNLRKG